jgi:predicted ATP-grasp superfamily ATP-dependent carboligase
VLLVGYSTRALADAALRSGFRPRTVDFFGDLDQKARLENLALGRDLRLSWSALEAARIAERFHAERVAYAFDLENRPDAVERLARNRELLGNTASALRAVRDPARLFRILGDADLPTPLTVFPDTAGAGPADLRAPSPPHHAGPGSGPARSGPGGRWLVKPQLGGGGRGIARAEPGRIPGPDEMLQELVEGPAIGFSFLADGKNVRPLGLAAQLVETRAFGAVPFAYVGSLSCLPPGLDPGPIREQAVCAAEVVTRACGLRGWNGMDFVVRNGEVVVLEVNPRHTSSMELWDGPGARLFAAHAEACRGRIEGSWLPEPEEVRGKALLFAKRAVRARETLAPSAAAPGAAASGTARGAESGPAWPERAVADIPHPGERIARGQPVCSLFATGPSADACLAALRELALRVEAQLEGDGAYPAGEPAPASIGGAAGGLA